MPEVDSTLSSRWSCPIATTGRGRCGDEEPTQFDRRQIRRDDQSVQTAGARKIGEKHRADAVGAWSPVARWPKGLLCVLPVLILSTQQAVAQGNDIPNARTSSLN